MKAIIRKSQIRFPARGSQGSIDVRTSVSLGRNQFVTAEHTREDAAENMLSILMIERK